MLTGSPGALCKPLLPALSSGTMQCWSLEGRGSKVTLTYISFFPQLNTQLLLHL